MAGFTKLLDCARFGSTSCHSNTLNSGGPGPNVVG